MLWESQTVKLNVSNVCGQAPTEGLKHYLYQLEVRLSFPTYFAKYFVLCIYEIRRNKTSKSGDWEKNDSEKIFKTTPFSTRVYSLTAIIMYSICNY